MIDTQKAFTYFTERYAFGKPSNGWYPMDCPFCINGEHKRKLAIKFIWDFTKCWVCSWRGSITDFVMETEDLSYFDAKNKLEAQEASSIDATMLEQIRTIKKSDVLLPIGFNSIMEGKGIMGKRARNYLTERGFELEILDRMGFGYCDQQPENPEDNREDDYFGYIILPFKSRGILKYFIGRDFLGNQFIKYKNPATEKFGIGKGELLFNEDALELYDEVFLLEGAFDSMIMGKNGVASLGWSLSQLQKIKMMKSDVKKLTFVPDKGFYKVAVKTAMEFLDEKEVRVVNMDNVIPENPEKKDVNEIGRELVMQEVEQTPVLTFSMAMDITTD